MAQAETGVSNVTAAEVEAVINEEVTPPEPKRPPDPRQPTTPETRKIATAFVADFKQLHGYEFEELFEGDLLRELEKMLDERAEDLHIAHEEEHGQSCVWRK